MALKDVLFKHFAQRHFDLMSPDVRDHFDDLAKDGDFSGNMKYWYDHYTPDGASYAPTPDLSLTAPEWETLYDEFQATMQKMEETRSPSVGWVENYKKPTLNFISRWFGDDTKTFSQSVATSDTKTKFRNLATFLQANHSLRVPFEANIRDLDYDDFCKKLRDGKYDTDVDFRKTVGKVIEYIRSAGPQEGATEEPNPTYWPSKVGYTTSTTTTGTPPTTTTTVTLCQGLTDIASLDTDSSKWYEVPHKSLHIEWFKRDYKKLFDEILTSSAVRKDFLEAAGKVDAKNTVTALTTAMKDTAYDDKEDKDNYLTPKLVDKKNWRQKLKKWGNDTYENHFRRFTNPSRGTRLYFSMYSQNIMKGFDKAGIKPTDGLKGILDKKDDPKLRSAIDGSPTTKKHFDWFIEKLGTLQKSTPDAFEGALRNGAQMRQLVSNLIVIAAEKGEMDEAKTALEILSVAKYGLSSSRTVDALRKMDFDLLSNKDYSWMKNEGIAFVARATDRLAKGIIVGAGAIGAGMYNFAQHRRTKIKKDIRNNKILNDAYKNWTAEDAKRRSDLHDSNVVHNVAGNLTDLANSGRTPRVATEFRTNYAITPTNLGAAETMLAAWRSGTATPPPISGPDGAPATPEDLESDIEKFKDANATANTTMLSMFENGARVPVSATNYKTNYAINAGNIAAAKAMLTAWQPGATPPVAIYGPGRAATPEDLASDIALFEDSTARQNRETNWRDDNPDIIHDLIAYWDMLESFGKSHSFMLGNMNLKRKSFLAQKAKSRAQQAINGLETLKTR
ncbi:MAG: hypothetical protein MJ165_03740 [Alphaproteobacteria bacterium]|nr:hypothetical protein [Alphaproteobacteria bacterium]